MRPPKIVYLIIKNNLFFKDQKHKKLQERKIFKNKKKQYYYKLFEKNAKSPTIRTNSFSTSNSRVKIKIIDLLTTNITKKFTLLKAVLIQKIYLKISNNLDNIGIKDYGQ